MTLDKRGAVYLMSGLIEEGAGDMDARTYARDAGIAGGLVHGMMCNR